jgi:hypothetical protein
MIAQGYDPPAMKRRLSWAVLLLLLAALLVGVATFDRRTWPHLVGDEATYLMQAESLAFDLDLAYERGDYERFRQHWNQPPDGVILQSPDRGASFTFGKPAFYAFYLAPFVRVAPVRGGPIANVLLLAFACILAARVLERRLGETAPLWVAAFAFGSVTFANVLWMHADLFLLCASAIALALAYDREPSSRLELPEIWGDPIRRAFPWRLVLAGGLLTIVLFSRLFYASLLLPVLLTVPKRERLRGALALGLGVALVGGVAVAGSYALGGSWTPYGGERLGFYSHTGFPKVDLQGDWPALVEARGRGSWIAPGRLLPYAPHPGLLAHNLESLLVGRHVGLLVYFLPLLLGFSAYRKGEGRWALPLAALAAISAFLLVRPFNFWGGGAALANRYFLPVFPAFWFMAARPRSWLYPLLVVLAAAPFLYPLWLEPRAFPYRAEGGFRHVSPWARDLLPYETTQAELKPSGQEDVVHNGLWVKPLGPEVRVAGDHFTLVGRAPAEVLVGVAQDLTRVRLELLAPGPAQARLNGREPVRRTLEPNGSVQLEFELGPPTARHPTWWSWSSWALYRLEIEPSASGAATNPPIRFRLARL